MRISYFCHFHCGSHTLKYFVVLIFFLLCGCERNHIITASYFCPLLALQAEKAGKKRNYLSLEKKVEVIKYSQRNPGTNVRDLRAPFSCGKTQIAQILKNKDSLLSMYHSNASGSRIHTKRYFEYQNLLK